MGGRAPFLLSLLVHACRGDGDAICRDGSHDCPNWAQSGNCESNAIYMAKHCRLSCKLCEPPPGRGPPVGWNFESFLVSRKGELVKRYPTGTVLTSKEVKADIEAELSLRTEL